MLLYLKKQAFCPAIIENNPQIDLGIFIVIPAYNEISLLPIIKSLYNCKKTSCSVEVLVVFNAAETADKKVIEINETAKAELDNFIAEQRLNSNKLAIYTCQYNALPPKHAGVGLARKIGMDEAVRRFYATNQKGIIVNVDADCIVSENYLVAIERHFQNPKLHACSIYFEHPLNYTDILINQAIIDYEMHLRYFINMQRLINFPWAFQTIGSAMAVRANIYCEQGGMNKRKAGEDFYFLQKIIELGYFSELNTCCVYASSRKSDRVPFGTGKAIIDITDKNEKINLYNPKSFYQLQVFFQSIDQLYLSNNEEIASVFVNFPAEINHFLSLNHWQKKLLEIRQHTTDLKSFKKRFFREFNAFQLMKYVHWMRDNYFENMEIQAGIAYLFKQINLEIPSTTKDCLLKLRNFDRKSNLKFQSQ